MIARRRPIATFSTVIALAAGIAATALAGSSISAFAATTSPGPLNLAPYLTIQDKNLDCEAAALAAAFLARGISVNTGTSNLQNWIFNQLPDDHRNAIVAGGNITWGDPYVDFVGNVNGHEGFAPGDGYGVYYQPIADVVTKVGHTEVAKTGWTTASIEAELQAGNPVVVWIDFRSLASGAGYPTSTWTGFDGRKVPYTLHEHAVTVLGTYPGQSVTLLDVHSGNQYTYSEFSVHAHALDVRRYGRGGRPSRGGPATESGGCVTGAGGRSGDRRPGGDRHRHRILSLDDGDPGRHSGYANGHHDHVVQYHHPGPCAGIRPLDGQDIEGVESAHRQCRIRVHGTGELRRAHAIPHSRHARAHVRAMRCRRNSRRIRRGLCRSPG